MNKFLEFPIWIGIRHGGKNLTKEQLRKDLNPLNWVRCDRQEEVETVLRSYMTEGYDVSQFLFMTEVQVQIRAKLTVDFEFPGRP